MGGFVAVTVVKDGKSTQVMLEDTGIRIDCNDAIAEIGLHQFDSDKLSFEINGVEAEDTDPIRNGDIITVEEMSDADICYNEIVESLETAEADIHVGWQDLDDEGRSEIIIYLRSLADELGAIEITKTTDKTPTEELEPVVTLEEESCQTHRG